MPTYHHYQKFENIAQTIGVQKLKNLLPVKSKDKLLRAYDEDPYLNSIPLKKWDSKYTATSKLANQANLPFWSMSYNISVLKHVAKYHVMEIPAPQEKQ